MLARTSRSLFAAALAIAAFGCSTGDSTGETTPTTDGGQPIVIMLGIAPNYQCSCSELITGADTSKPYVLTIEVMVAGEFLLRPPGFCSLSGATQCGYLEANVTGSTDGQDVIVQSSTKVIQLPFGGSGVVSVRALRDNGEMIAQSDPPTVSAEKVSCPPLDESGKCLSSSGSGGSDAGADGG